MEGGFWRELASWESEFVSIISFLIFPLKIASESAEICDQHLDFAGLSQATAGAAPVGPQLQLGSQGVHGGHLHFLWLVCWVQR